MYGRLMGLVCDSRDRPPKKMIPVFNDCLSQKLYVHGLDVEGGLLEGEQAWQAN